MHCVRWEQCRSPSAGGGLGFHGVSRWQGPLLAKFAWELMQPGSSLFHRLVLARYTGRLWWEGITRRNSPVWRLIREGVACLWPLIRWKIADGDSVDVLAHAWILDWPLSRWPTFADYGALESLQVSVLLFPGGGWDIFALSQFFGPSLVKVVLQIPVHSSFPQDRPELCTCLNRCSVASLAYATQFDGACTDFS
ncbi:hypothetical protein KSP39_PZI008113 [Platanthera zijinensis]|uniref:Reverse transcriptase zinc-binding domain-containing protein n=1 Tax=Platanthera zijinensis TaxID=2320716 RepID=A0AAP0BNA6_9ASPA